jgi:cobalt-zinc-cadmium efflux system membrane fusion protein
MKTLFFTAALAAWLISPIAMNPVFAQETDGHVYEESHEAHDETEGHAHDDHGEEADNHDGHGHDEHEEKDTHDDHGHEDAEDAHGDEDGEHEEGKTEIAPDMAKQAGVSIEKAGSATIASVIPLTGRITVNENTKANVRARFTGIIRSVKANLGETVEKGQVLAVIEANESLQDYNVTSPINGVILERNTNIGDVANGEPLFVIADLSNVWAKFHVFPKDADIVKSGQSVRVHTLDESRAGTATIDMLFPTADALSQTLVAIAPLLNEKGQWRPGMTVEGDVSVSQKQVPLAVRTSALQTMEDQTVLFVKEGNAYEQVHVETGVSDGQYVEIISGLKAGQDYVSEGSFVIKADILKAGAEHSH